ncbi:MAG: carboxypeptidase-like regulatory domain-containing protein [Longimicrobiales bacterium]|nr:carboxypeptidase-like regulatory domain-containing protein [Longimicrobiales bacterium]
MLRFPRAGAHPGWRFSPLLALVTAVLLLGAEASGLRAQATSAAALSGQVLDGFEDPVVNALVTLLREGSDGDVGRELSTDRQGRFTVSGLRPGRYQVRVEALGFHPRLLRGLTLRPRSHPVIGVRLREATPPVTVVDTAWATVGGGESGQWLDELEFGAPAPSRQLTEALEVVSTLDAGGGSLGLPSGFTTYQVQGVPFRGAALAPGLQSAPAALSTGSAGLVRVAPLDPSHGFGFGAGGVVEIFNASLAAGESELFAAYSWDDLWTGRFDIGEGLTPTSLWASGRTAFDLVPDSARVTVGADVHHVEVPRQALFPGGSRFQGPGLQDFETVSAFALVDWDLGGGHLVDLGVRVGSRPDAPSVAPLAYPGRESALEAQDVVVGGGLLTRVGARTSLALRAGFTRSERSGAEDWPLDAASPFLFDARSGRQGGVAPLAGDEVTRRGLFGSAALLHDVGAHRLEGGFEVLRTTHEIAPGADAGLFAGAGDPFAQGWLGWGTRLVNLGAEADFSVTDFAAFFRDTWRPAPGIELRVGGRWHSESLPVDDLTPDPTWEAVSGLTTPIPDDRADRLTGHVGLDWAPGGDSPVRISANAGATVDEVDPWILAEAISLDGSVERERVRSGTGGFAAFPDFPEAGAQSRSATALTLLPAEVDLPVTGFAALTVSADVQGWTVGASGVFRRTENLFRRTDLNRVDAPLGTTEGGLPVWGTPVQVGALVVEDPGSSRRFEGFDHVWALVQDGWSEYRGVTLFTERRATSGPRIAAWYTYSEATDNLPGLGSGRPELAMEHRLDGRDTDWSDGTSDLEVPHRVGVSAALPVPVFEGAWLRGRFRYESGRPFTPGVRDGVDLDADGVPGNEPVWIAADGLDGLPARWDCVREQRGGFVERNSCTLPDVPYLDIGVSLGLVRLGGGVVSLQVDALNVLQAFDTTVDPALFLVNPSGSLRPDGSALSPDLSLNPRLGGEIFDTRDGRMIRLGLRWGGGR